MAAARRLSGEIRSCLSENQIIYVPVSTKHRLEKENDGDLVLIEVQTGVSGRGRH